MAPKLFLAIDCPSWKMSFVHSKAWSPRKVIPPMTVSMRNLRSPRWSPWRMAASASTMVTLEQMRRNVMKAVSWTPRMSFGTGQVGSP